MDNGEPHPEERRLTIVRRIVGDEHEDVETQTQTQTQTQMDREDIYLPELDCMNTIPLSYLMSGLEYFHGSFGFDLSKMISIWLLVLPITDVTLWKNTDNDV